MKHFSTLFRTIVAAAGLLLVGFAAYHGWLGAQEILRQPCHGSDVLISSVLKAQSPPDFHGKAECGISVAHPSSPHPVTKPVPGPLLQSALRICNYCPPKSEASEWGRPGSWLC